MSATNRVSHLTRYYTLDGSAGQVMLRLAPSTLTADRFFGSWSKVLLPTHPNAVTLRASSEAIDALLGTKRSSPRVVPDESKLAATNCASRGSARSQTFGAVRH